MRLLACSNTPLSACTAACRGGGSVGAPEGKLRCGITRQQQQHWPSRQQILDQLRSASSPCRRALQPGGVLETAPWLVLQTGWAAPSPPLPASGMGVRAKQAGIMQHTRTAFQSTGVATGCFAPRCRASTTRSTSAKLRPTAGGYVIVRATFLAGFRMNTARTVTGMPASSFSCGVAAEQGGCGGGRARDIPRGPAWPAPWQARAFRQQ